MRYEKGHASVTRQKILDVAADRFRTDGIAASGVATLMSDAGLTNGAFYTHFESKDHLIRDAMGMPLKADHPLNEPSDSVDIWLAKYLSPEHRDNPRSGCTVAALASEVARQSDPVKTAFSQKVDSAVDKIIERLPDGSDQQKRSIATALYALGIGTIQLARTTADPVRSDEILAEGLAAAKQLIASITAR